MKSKAVIYWISQLTGWFVFNLINLITTSFQGPLTLQVYFSAFLIFALGILLTHSYRSLVKTLKWTQLRIQAIILRIFLSSLILSIVFSLLYGGISDLFLDEMKPVITMDEYIFLIQIVNFTTLFFIWNMIYFAVHIFDANRRQKIKNLELKAAMTEIELTSFKAQMNPHFMFNALNSIRALIDEDPQKAKTALTLLSGILRSTLVSGKRKTVSLKEELNLVKSYLAIEKIRFEERLKVNIDIEDSMLDLQVPPLMLQTIVENGIKHGISKLKKGGEITIYGKVENGNFKLQVTNSGSMVPRIDDQGIGISNTIKRLKALYGSRAQFTLIPIGDTVRASFILPSSKNI